MQRTTEAPRRRVHMPDVATQSVVYRNTFEDKSIKRPRVHWFRLVLVLLVPVVFTLGIWLLWMQAVIPTWGNLNNQWHYGDGRITQVDANVGHDGVSHFVAEYYQGRIVVMEISLSNPNDFHTYTLGGVIGANDTPVIVLTVTNANQDSKPDLVVQVQGTNFNVVLYNTGSAFAR